MPDKWAQYAQPTQQSQGDKWAQYADAPEPPEPTTMQKMASGAKDVGMGILKGAGSTANNLGHLLLPDWALKAAGVQGPTAEKQESYFAPKNTAQSIGKGVEQAGEFLIPGAAEDEAATKMAQYAPKVISRIGASALGSGLVNKAQGGGFGTGAAAGAVGGAVGAGLHAVAPRIAESALNIRKLDRAYGKGGGAIGRSILDETTGLTPSSVAESAQGKLNELNPKLNKMADAMSQIGPISDLRPAQDQLINAGIKAEQQGERTTLGQLQPMMTHLGETVQGKPIPSAVTPRQLLDLKRGFGNEFIHRWNPETMEGVKGTAANAYHEMGEEFNKSVPGASELNGRISRLIPVAKRAESAELNAPTTQRMFQRIAAPTGALTGAIGGGAAGYEQGGVTGAAKGAAAGLMLPLLLTTPTGEMMMARGANALSRPVSKMAAGSLLQLDRKQQDPEDRNR